MVQLDALSTPGQNRGFGSLSNGTVLEPTGSTEMGDVRGSRYSSPRSFIRRWTSSLSHHGSRSK